jgi:eukaryotic-like serine/threonine-protein kinase
VPAGTLVGGKYQLLRLLGRGAFGHVYEAEHADVGRRYAVKLLHWGLDSARTRQRFAREARVLARLEHENIVGLIDLGEDAECGDYLVLELVRGSTLRSALPALQSEAPERALSIIRQIARGLAHAHAEGIVHRDLKPENVMLTSHADGRLLVKILDFGIARLLHAEQEEFMTTSGATVGTAAYMAPEQARGDRDVDSRADVYALGVIAYEALGGVRPFEGTSYNETLFNILTKGHTPLAELRPDLDPTLSNLIGRALMKDRNERFESVETFAEALCQVGRSGLASVDVATVDFDSDERVAAPRAPTAPRPSGASPSSKQSTPSFGRKIRVLLLAATAFALGVATHDVWFAKDGERPLTSARERPNEAPRAAREVASDTKALGTSANSAVEPNRTSAAPEASTTASSRASEPRRIPVSPAHGRPSERAPRDRGF